MKLTNAHLLYRILYVSQMKLWKIGQHLIYTYKENISFTQPIFTKLINFQGHHMENLIY